MILQTVRNYVVKTTNNMSFEQVFKHVRVFLRFKHSWLLQLQEHRLKTLPELTLSLPLTITVS